MALSDFLSNGQIPTGSALTSTTTNTALPDWYTNYAMQLLSNQQAAAAQPYTTFQGPRVASFTPGQQQGFGMTGQAATAYQPALNSATTATQNVMAAPGAAAAAQPFAAQAGQTSVANVGQYMNPYTDQVVNRIGDLAGRNLRENILPALESKYISAGQLGFGPRGALPSAGAPSGMMTDTARAIRDTQEATLAEQSKALQSGYNTAAELSGTDLARQLQLAQLTGSLTGTDLSRQLAAAEQMGALGSSAQALGLTGAKAVTDVGGLQQGLDQKNLDVAYQDFLRQQGYPQEQINNMLATFKGLPSIPTSVSKEGIEAVNQPTTSTASNIAGGLATGVGLIKAIKDIF